MSDNINDLTTYAVSDLDQVSKVEVDTQSQPVQMDIEHINMMINTMSEFRVKHYYEMRSVLMKSIIANLLQSNTEPQPPNQVYSKLKKYPYIRDNTHMLEGYDYEQFMKDYNFVKANFREWQGLE
jgi:cobalamin biosynthesis Co2+ chelatase CbiK